MVLVVAGLLGAGAGAQTVPEVDITRTDLSEFPTVQLQVAVSGDAAAEELEASDLEVTENGEPLDIELTPLSGESLDVVLAIDISGSMAGEPLAQAKAAALEFIDQLPSDARVAVVSFAVAANLASEFTDDRDATREAINGLAEGGGTALYDGVVLAQEQLAASDASRSAMVVLTDGADDGSGTSLEAASDALAGTEGEFFAVSLQTGETDEAALAALAEAAGGNVVPAGDPDALAAAYVDLSERIVNQYDITFESATDAPTAEYEITVASTGDSATTELALPSRPGGATDSDSDEGAAPLDVEPLVTEGSASPIEQGWVLWLGAAFFAVALGILAYVLTPTDEPRVRNRSLRSDSAPVDSDLGPGERLVGSVRATATRVADRAVERSERGRLIDSALDRAGLAMRSGEFVALVFGVAVLAGFLLYLLMGIVGLLLGVLVPALGAPAFLRFLASRRNAKFADQLSDTLLMMSGSLRSGFGLGQVIDQVADEMDPPIGDEFQRAVLETRLGRDVEDALGSIAARVQNEDFEWVVDAIRIHRQVGGDLSQILEKLSETIRARSRLRRQISALTAEGRLSAIVLGSLPVAMGLILYASNPDYLQPLFDRTVGWIALGVAGGLLVTGVLWLRKLINVEM